MFVFFRGQILCSLGDELGQQLPQCLPIFLDRLRNEITRLTTVKAYSLIAGYVDQILYSPFAMKTRGTLNQIELYCKINLAHRSF